jgi:hypothetical protein
VVCAVAALIFGALAVLQARALPARPPVDRSADPAWRAVAQLHRAGYLARKLAPVPAAGDVSAG